MVTRELGLLVRIHEVASDHIVYVDDLQLAMKGVLEDPVVGTLEENAVDVIRCMMKQPRDTDLKFLDRVRMLFKTSTRVDNETEFLSGYFGKLPSNLHDHILEWKDAEGLTSEELVCFFKKRERDLEVKGLSDMQSIGTS